MIDIRGRILRRVESATGQYRVLLAMLMFATLTTHSNGAVVQPGDSASLADLVRQVLAQHPSVLAQRSELEAAERELSAAQWGRFPTVGVNSELDDSGDNQSVARIEQPLWSGGRISGQIELSRAQQDNASAALGDAEVSLTEETAAAFFEIVRLESQLKTATDNVATHQNLLETIRRRTRAEINPVADETLAMSRLNQALTEKILYERQLAVAYSQLEQLVDHPVQQLRAPRPVSLGGSPLADFEAAAIAFSPARRQALAEAEQGQAEIKLARAESLPTLVAGYQRTLEDTDFDSQPGERAYIAFQLQPGAGLSSLSVVRAASARRQAALKRVEAIERQLRQQVQSLWAEVEALQLQVPVVRQTMANADAIVESYLRQFQVGRKSWLDVLNVQREKAQAYISLADVEAPLELAKVRLLLLAGELNLEELEAMP